MAQLKLAQEGIETQWLKPLNHFKPMMKGIKKHFMKLREELILNHIQTYKTVSKAFSPKQSLKK
jgi:hypothetical protein